MRFIETPLPGAFRIEVEPIADDRGLFGRTFCREEFAAHGLNPDIAQCNTSFNPRLGTLRGMHFQADPHGEDKLVRCTAGAIYDVAIDLRPESPAFMKWHGMQLDADERAMFYIPKGMAHGFVTLQDNSEVLYVMSTPFVPGTGQGVRWDDPAFGIEWPVAPTAMSERDANYPDFSTEA